VKESASRTFKNRGVGVGVGVGAFVYRLHRPGSLPIKVLSSVISPTCRNAVGVFKICCSVK
jgi:hypothetical protein